MLRKTEKMNFIPLSHTLDSFKQLFVELPNSLLFKETRDARFCPSFSYTGRAVGIFGNLHYYSTIILLIYIFIPIIYMVVWVFSVWKYVNLKVNVSIFCKHDASVLALSWKCSCAIRST